MKKSKTLGKVLEYPNNILSELKVVITGNTAMTPKAYLYLWWLRLKFLFSRKDKKTIIVSGLIICFSIILLKLLNIKIDNFYYVVVGIGWLIYFIIIQLFNLTKKEVK